MMGLSKMKELLFNTINKFSALVRNDNYTAFKPNNIITCIDPCAHDACNQLKSSMHYFPKLFTYLQKVSNKKSATLAASLSFSGAASGHLLK